MSLFLFENQQEGHGADGNCNIKVIDSRSLRFFCWKGQEGSACFMLFL